LENASNNAGNTVAISENCIVNVRNFVISVENDAGNYGNSYAPALETLEILWQGGNSGNYVDSVLEMQWPALKILLPALEILLPALEILLPALEIQLPKSKILLPALEFLLPELELLLPTLKIARSNIGNFVANSGNVSS
jgi:hypothetical protein